MCGILGQINAPDLPDRFEEALACLGRRGPDALGIYRDPIHPVALGHTRLSIVDLSAAANQPLSNETGEVWLVANGEIYNAPSLRAQLEDRGHRFHSRSDNETILHAWEEWGPSCVERLRGMFAFGIWDRRQRALFLARDRLGIKPLYIRSDGARVTFASEARALLPLLEDRPPLDPLSLGYLLTIGYIPAPRSVYQGIEKLEPGTWRLLSLDGQSRAQRYWSPPDSADAGSSGRAAFGPLFQEVCEEHLQADVPCGLLLSAGLDSTAVAAALFNAGAKVNSFTVSFPELAENEAPLARRKARRFGFPFFEIPIPRFDAMAALERTGSIYDEPQAFTALATQHAVCAHAAQRNKVVLAGDGGDEALGGYRWYREDGKPGFPPDLDAFAHASPYHRHLARLAVVFTPHELGSLFDLGGETFTDELMIEPLERWHSPALKGSRPWQRIDLMTFCADCILPKVDQASMACGIEARVPFLDHRIVEWGIGKPCDAREDLEPKHELLDFLAPVLSPELTRFPKQGFSLRALDGLDWNLAQATLASTLPAQLPFLSANWQKAIAPNAPRRAKKIAALLLFESWRRHHP